MGTYCDVALSETRAGAGLATRSPLGDMLWNPSVNCERRWAKGLFWQAAEAATAPRPGGPK